MADGTTINQSTVAGGDVIATEDVLAGSSRGDSALPITEYKVPRSKIALGQYDADKGDVTPTNPMPVQSLHERRAAEDRVLLAAEAGYAALRSRSFERITMIDRRGGCGVRGVR